MNKRKFSLLAGVFICIYLFSVSAVAASPEVRKAISIAAGYKHSVMLLDDGTVEAWGDNSYGQCNVPAGLDGVVKVAAGDYHTVALLGNGTLVAWGSNYYGQADIPYGLSGVEDITAGNGFTVALLDDGTVTAWGYNGGGQTEVPEGLSGVIKIDANVGRTHRSITRSNYVIALTEDGQVVAWGQDRSDWPTRVPSSMEGIIDIAAGWDHAIALRDDGHAIVWGKLSSSGGLNNGVKVSAGYRHTVAILDDGSVTTWGSDSGDIPSDLSNVKDIQTGAYHTLALLEDGTVVAWGNYDDVPKIFSVYSKHGKPNPEVGNHQYDEGKEVTFSAGSPVNIASGRRNVCSGWAGAGDVPATGSSLPFSFTINQNSAVELYWDEQVELEVIVNPEGAGNIEGSGWHEINSVSEIIANEDHEGYSFLSWTKNGEFLSSEPKYAIELDAPKSLTANYEKIISYALSYEAGIRGYIEGEASQTLQEGEDGSEVTAVPEAGYHFVEWDDGRTDNPRKDENVTGDISVTAIFEQDLENGGDSTYELVYVADAGGSIEGDTNQEVEEGGDGTSVEAVSEGGYHFVQWSDGSKENPRTDDNVTADITVTALYDINQYTVTFQDHDGTELKTETVNHGSSATAPADPSREGYTFTGWDTDFGNVTGNITVTATYTVDFEDGDGTADNPYILTHTNQLDHIRDNLASYFEMEGDIDLDDVEDWKPIGTAADPFTGGFDGAGHVITNLSIDDSEADDIGLFGYTKGASIQRIGIEGADITGRDNVGGLVGYAISTSISESYVKGFITGRDTIGGLAGYLKTVSESLISNSYADCNVNGENIVGGTVGRLDANASIENSFAAGGTTGESDIGGLVGLNDNETHENIVNSFWNIDVGPEASDGGTGKSTNEMMQEETFTNWDFNSIWSIKNGATYPYLQWQPAPDIDDDDDLEDPGGDKSSSSSGGGCFIDTLKSGK